MCDSDKFGIFYEQLSKKSIHVLKMFICILQLKKNTSTIHEQSVLNILYILYLMIWIG